MKKKLDFTDWETEYEIVIENRLAKELAQMLKRGRSEKKFTDIILKLARGEKLPFQNRDHALSGEWIGYRDCHIEPDRILIYRIDGDKLILVLTRTGTHADLFGK